MAKKPDKKQQRSFIDRTVRFVRWAIHFATYDIWRITENELSGIRRVYIFLAKTVILAVRGFQDQRLSTRASALTYSTLLSIVPMLAVLTGIASGFGLRDTIRSGLYQSFPGHIQELNTGLTFAENYLKEAHGGLFLGIGLAMLFYTVVNLISTVEDTFNDIWQVSKSRSWRRKITDYLALIIMLPLLMTLSSGISIFMTTISASFLSEYVFLTPIADLVLKLAPFVIASLLFTVLFIMLPNTPVRFTNALVAGIVTGVAFQLFQNLYISGQLWVSRYNAIYGSFAALPLLLLWLQLSWLLCLFGAELAYASQNVKKFSFERDSTNITRRYRDFLTMLVMTLIVKRFERGERPYTADELSDAHRIPIRLTTDILYSLTAMGLLAETVTDEADRMPRYQPALDIHRITVGMLFRKIDLYGSENFKIDITKTFRREWEALLKTRTDMCAPNDNTLLKDL